MRGLVVTYYKADCLDLPPKQYRQIELDPSPRMLNVARAIAKTSRTTIAGLIALRELSDGFLYREIPDGTAPCSSCAASGQVSDVVGGESQNVPCAACRGTGQREKQKRIAHQVECPKELALFRLLQESADVGRIVIYAGFTGSIDRISEFCQSHGWVVVRCDGRGFKVLGKQGAHPLDYWRDKNNPRVAFVAHPESGGVSLTLTESPLCVFWSNSFKSEYRVQAEDRIHRPGMDPVRGATIVDLIHLPSDRRVLEVVRENRRLELLSLGFFTGANSDQTDTAASGAN
jgi:hypothetical protein